MERKYRFVNERKAGTDRHGHTLLRVTCECGQSKIIRRDHIRSGKVVSCGCYLASIRGAATITHGNTRYRDPTPTYRSWQNVLKRCNNPKSIQYRDYGGRGIRVCDRWSSFENFLADMGERPTGMSIERINNDLGYFPENCKWATRVEQAQNTRRTNIKMI